MPNGLDTTSSIAEMLRWNVTCIGIGDYRDALKASESHALQALLHSGECPTWPACWWVRSSLRARPSGIPGGTCMGIPESLSQRVVTPHTYPLKPESLGSQGYTPWDTRPRRFLLLKSYILPNFTANRRACCVRSPRFTQHRARIALARAPTCLSQGRKQARSCHQQPLTENLQRCVRAAHERYEHHQTHG
jgi:hypothetical protein